MNNSKSNNNIKEAIKIKLYVKYMVCLRDKLIVKSVLNKHRLNYRVTTHGAIEFLEEVTSDRLHKIDRDLSKSGLLLLDENESMLMDRIINTIVEIIHQTDTLPKVNFKDLISDYSGSGNESILKIFSDVKGISVLQFIVLQKIERAKELLIYDELPLRIIADILNYKNQDYFVAQFEKITGLTPFYFKRLKKERRKISEKHNHSTFSEAAVSTA